MKRLSQLVLFVLISATLPAVTAVIPLGGSADAQTTSAVQLMYLLTPGATADPDAASKVTANFNALQGFMQDDVGRTLRVKPGVTTARVTNGGADSLRSQLENQGFDDPNTIYLSFAMITGNPRACGESIGRYPFLYLSKTNTSCPTGLDNAPNGWPFDATYLAMHELLHALGAVPSCAPNSDGTGHVNDSNNDVLFLGAALPLTIDVNHDDYYGHDNAGCFDVEDSPYWAGPASDPDEDPCALSNVTINMNTNGGNGNGTAGRDVILGTDGVDRINGFGGDDVLCGQGGIDYIRGGGGDDTIYGDGGSDRIWGNAGKDTVFAGSGADRVWGGSGPDELHGMGGKDFMWGEAGNDFLQGNSQSDQLRGGEGNDDLRGAGGKDKLYGDAGNDLLAGGNNTDFLDGGPGTDSANGQRGKDNNLPASNVSINVAGCIAETLSSC